MCIDPSTPIALIHFLSEETFRTTQPFPQPASINLYLSTPLVEYLIMFSTDAEWFFSIPSSFPFKAQLLNTSIGDSI